MSKINKIGLTDIEMNLIYDSMNGIMHNLSDLIWKHNIVSGLKEKNKYENLDKKWGVNMNILVKKLNEYTELEMLEVLEIVRKFWRTEEENFTVFGTITLSEKREEILSQQKEA